MAYLWRRLAMYYFDWTKDHSISKIIQICGYFSFLMRFALSWKQATTKANCLTDSPASHVKESALLDQSATEVVKHDKEVTNLLTEAMLSAPFKPPPGWLILITNCQTEPGVDADSFKILQKDLFPVKIATAVFTLCKPVVHIWASQRAKAHRKDWHLACCHSL